VVNLTFYIGKPTSSVNICELVIKRSKILKDYVNWLWSSFLCSSLCNWA